LQYFDRVDGCEELGKLVLLPRPCLLLLLVGTRYNLLIAEWLADQPVTSELKLKEHWVVEVPLDAGHALFVQIQFDVLQSDFASTLHWELWINEGDWVDI